MEANVVAATMARMPEQIIETLTLENEEVNRYVWYAGEDLPWPEIKGGFIKRCRVTPIVIFEMWDRIAAVPEEMRKKLRRDWMDRDHQEALYHIRPQGIFNSIMETYGHYGVVELEALKGMTEQQVAGLNLDAIFSPWHSDDIPKPYREIEEQIKKALAGIGDPVIQSVGQQMLKSIAVSRAYDEQFVDFVESQKELKYSHPAFRALSRLERRRRDTAQNQAAELQNKVFEKIPDILAGQQGGNNDAILTALVEQNQLMREELKQNREMMTALLAERKPGRPPKQAEVNA